MTEFVMELVQFVVQAAVILLALLVLIGFIAGLVSKGSEQPLLKVKNLNKKLNKLRLHLLKATGTKKDFKKASKASKKSMEKLTDRPRAYVLNFEGDIRATAVEHLRHEVTSILMSATDKDQVILKLESGGGVVHGYGLAASQLKRITDRKIQLIVCIDKIAASGGYMMACLGSKVLSAPFAIIGSIGVVAAMPNVHRLLEKNSIDYLEITAGEFKRTITPLGKITEQGMSKFKEQIEDVHVLFKHHVSTMRPQLDIAKVATGEYWFGIRAKELQLVDELKTSDEYIHSLNESHQIIEVLYKEKKSLKDKLAESMELAFSNASERLLNRLNNSKFL